MSEDPRPWWASAADADRLEDVDPIEAFRSSRRPAADTDDPPSADDPTATPDDVLTGADPDPAPASDSGHRPELCGICPLCSLARTLEETRPELMEHLTEAARHLAAAVRALVDTPDPHGGGASDGDRRSRSRARGDHGAVQHIPLDARPSATGAAGANRRSDDPGGTDGAGDDG